MTNLLEKIPKSEPLSLSYLDGQSFTITGIRKTEYSCVGVPVPQVYITTKEVFRNTRTNTICDEFYTDRTCVVRYLTKHSTLDKLEKKGSMGPLVCKSYDKSLAYTAPFELCAPAKDNEGNTTFTKSLLTKREKQKIVCEVNGSFQKYADAGLFKE